MQHRRIVIGLTFGMVFGVVSTVKAQGINGGDFLRALFRGTEFAGNPLFLSTPQGGPNFDFNQFSQRVEFNRAGDGYTYEFFRFFGPDSFNNPTFLDLGPLQVELAPDLNLGQVQLTGIHGRVGFTTRFIPEVFFEAETGQRQFNQFQDVGTFSVEPLAYRVTFNTGIQDFEWAGNALIDTGGRINALGFYDFDLRFVNVGNFEADGVILQDEQVTDFDVGPVNVSGHIVLDALASLIQANGSEAGALPPRIFSAAAQKEKTVDDLLAQLEAGDPLTNEEAQFLIQQMFIEAFRLDPIGMIMNGLPAEVPGFEGLSLQTSAITDPQASAQAAVAPEAGTLLMFTLAAVFLLIRFTANRRRAVRYGMLAW